MRRKAWIMASCVVGLASVGALGPVQAADPLPPARARDGDDIDVLMARLHAMPGLYARFTESKSIGLLAVPLINEGTIHYAPPGRLLRTIETPHRTQVLLVEDEIWLREGGASEHIDLAAHPAVRSFVSSFRSLLAGDREALARHFELELQTGDDESWTLQLRPRTKAMARIVVMMRVSGHREILERLVIKEASGDVSDTRFVAVDPERRYSDDEAARLFKPG
jgi:hypothetical protein